MSFLQQRKRRDAQGTQGQHRHGRATNVVTTQIGSIRPETASWKDRQAGQDD